MRNGRVFSVCVCLWPGSAARIGCELVCVGVGLVVGFAVCDCVLVPTRPVSQFVNCPVCDYERLDVLSSRVIVCPVSLSRSLCPGPLSRLSPVFLNRQPVHVLRPHFRCEKSVQTYMYNCSIVPVGNP